MARNESVRDSLLQAEADLEQREAALLLVEVSELLDQVPDSALQPRQHEKLVSLKEDTRDLHSDLK